MCYECKEPIHFKSKCSKFEKRSFKQKEEKFDGHLGFDESFGEDAEQANLVLMASVHFDVDDESIDE